jgi:hypothetical protein
MAMTMWTTRSLSDAMISERHHAAAQARIARRHRVDSTARPGIGRSRLAGSIAVLAALALLLVSIPVLSAAPSAATSAPMPSPTPGQAPWLVR